MMFGDTDVRSIESWRGSFSSSQSSAARATLASGDSTSRYAFACSGVAVGIVASRRK